MARPLRLEFAGALYHVTARGDRREAIYETDDDRADFLTVLEDVCQSFNWLCHAYCLMTNHYHLLIETPDGNLSKGMRQLNGVYTQRFNRCHGRVGHVFQGRYKAILVEKQAYLVELARYIVLNPVRAGMVNSVMDWPWSSYRATIEQAKPASCLHTQWLLAAFAERKIAAIKAYIRFVDEGKQQSSPWAALKNQIYLGSDKYVENLLSLIDPSVMLSEIPASQRRRIPKLIEQYETEATNRDEAILTAYESGGYSMKLIGDHFGLHYSRVSRIISKAKGKT